MGTINTGTYNQLHNLSAGLANSSKTNFRKNYSNFDPNHTTSSSSYLSAKDLI